MILSPKTIDILTNFSSINPSMKLDWDGSIGVISKQGSILAVADVPERYPFPWYINDVPQMIGAIKLLDPVNSKAETRADHVVFSQPGSRIIYRFTEASLIKSVENKNNKLNNIYAAAQFPWQKIQQIIKGANTLRNTHIEFTCEDNVIVLKSYTENNSAANMFFVEIDPYEDQFDLSDFVSCRVKLEYFNLVNHLK